jgi:DNA polymerase II small subunit/DNA polymerase delta subunit B
MFLGKFFYLLSNFLLTFLLLYFYILFYDILDDVPTMLVDEINEDGEGGGKAGRETGDRPITILRNTLKWGHMCPTAPGK